MCVACSVWMSTITFAAGQVGPWMFSPVFFLTLVSTLGVHCNSVFSIILAFARSDADSLLHM